MKKLLCLLAVTVLAAASALAAGSGAYNVTVLNTGTNVIAASGSLTPTSAIIDAAKQNNVCLQLSYKLSGTGATTLSAFLHKSVDGVTYETSPSGTLAVVANGTNTVCGTLNIETLGARYLKVVSIANGNSGTSAVNDLVLKAGIKPAID
jgi:hypothetical protein